MATDGKPWAVFVAKFDTTLPGQQSTQLTPWARWVPGGLDGSTASRWAWLFNVASGANTPGPHWLYVAMHEDLAGVP